MLSKYLGFSQIENPGRKTEVWLVWAARTGSPLAVIRWSGAWRQYVMFPEDGTIWSTGCLADIQTFIGELMAARRAA